MSVRRIARFVKHLSLSLSLSLSLFARLVPFERHPFKVNRGGLNEITY